MELKKVIAKDLKSGTNYLIKRIDRWMVAQYFVNEYGVGMWYSVDGLSREPINGQIYELPKH